MLLSRLEWLWGVEIIAGQYLRSSYHSLIYINQIKHVLCCLHCPTKIKWKAAAALLSTTRPRCLLFAGSCQSFISSVQVQGHICEGCFWPEEALDVASSVYLWREVSFQTFTKRCISNEVQSSLPCSAGGWGVSMGNSPETSSCLW